MHAAHRSRSKWSEMASEWLPGQFPRGFWDLRERFWGGFCKVTRVVSGALVWRVLGQVSGGCWEGIVTGLGSFRDKFRRLLWTFAASSDLLGGPGVPGRFLARSLVWLSVCGEDSGSNSSSRNNRSNDLPSGSLWGSGHRHVTTSQKGDAQKLLRGWRSIR